MDNGQPFGGEGSVVETYDCHPLNDDEVNQSWNYTEDSTIVSLQNGTRCIGADASGTGRLSSACDQKFELKNGTFVHQPSGKCLTAKSQGFPKPLPKLNIRPDGIFSQGGSSGGDMAIQFHMAFSKNVSGVCGNDAQPYHCAVTRFPADELIPQTNESSVPFCYGCPDGYTVLYDKCKNHPQDVDVGMLPDYPRRVCGDGGAPGCIDDAANIYDDWAYFSRGECRTYIGGAEVNTLALYGMMTTDPQRQLLYVDKCNTSDPTPVDDDSNCMNHVFGQGGSKPLNPPANYSSSPILFFDSTPFLVSYDIGFEGSGFAYIPEACYSQQCDMLVRFHGCGGMQGVDQDNTIHRYAESNGIVVLYPRIRKMNNVTETHQNVNEIARGCWDGYGQLSEDYALQSGQHMASVWNMVKHISGRF